ncbi:MAG: type II toxin-antitoxin system HicA family toxin [Methanoregulaceae archaeon]|nr:type II toxin-antitoxin system HicA family toxin [Methanoregulaceae archaeon]
MPRDVSGKQLIKALSKLGFTAERQSGSHVRLRHQGTGDSVTVPMHDPIRVGT